MTEDLAQNNRFQLNSMLVTSYSGVFSHILKSILANMWAHFLVAALQTSTLAKGLGDANNADYCPRFHQILGHYDPSGPILIDGVWHVFPDGGGTNGAWSHFTSTDLLRWSEHASNAGGHDTGSVSYDPISGRGVVLFPDGHGHLLRQVPAAQGASGRIDPAVNWTKPECVYTNNRSLTGLGVGFRDPARALLMGDGSYYVAVGSGFGGDNDNTGLPANGTGCMAFLRANSSAVENLTFVGCLLTNNRTTGHINPSTIAWNSTDLPAAFMECPDVFPLDLGVAAESSSGLLSGSGAEKQKQKQVKTPQTFVAIASLYNWHEGAYFSNEWWSGTIEMANASSGKKGATFSVLKRGLLDFGQYYAARSGGEIVQRGDGRRVLFSATGWHNTRGWPGGLPCHTQMHLLPRELTLDATGRLLIAPVREVAETLRIGGGPAAGGMKAIGKGTRLDLELNCTGVPTGTAVRDGSSSTLDDDPIVGLTVLAAAAAMEGESGGGGDPGVIVAYNYTSQSLIVRGGGNSQIAPLADLTHGGSSSSSSSRSSVSVSSGGGATEISLRVLVDGALLESFLNSRVAISSLVTNVFQGKDSPRPPSRTATALPPPPGVTCTFAAYTLDALHPAWVPPVNHP